MGQEPGCFPVTPPGLSPPGGRDPKPENQTWLEELRDVEKRGPGVGANASQQPLHFREKVKHEARPQSRRRDGCLSSRKGSGPCERRLKAQEPSQGNVACGLSPGERPRQGGLASFPSLSGQDLMACSSQELWPLEELQLPKGKPTLVVTLTNVHWSQNTWRAVPQPLWLS